MNRWSIWGMVIAVLYLITIAPTPVANAAKHSSTSATAYHINAQHDGLAASLQTF